MHSDDILKDLIKQFMPFAQKHIGFTSPPRLFLKKDSENAKNPLGRTAHYEPASKSVHLYVSGRHPKDILRSLGHELVHHQQHCDGMFDGSEYLGPGYAQKDPTMRKAEELANKIGSMCLRDFEDMLKAKNETIYYEHLQKGDNKMSLKDWKEKEIGTLLSEAWGFKFNTLQEFEEFGGKGEIQTEGEEEVTEEGAEAAAGETVEESAEEELEESEEPVEELAGGKQAPRRTGADTRSAQARRSGVADDDKQLKKPEAKMEESEDEAIEEAEEEIEEKRMKGRGGDPRNLRGPKLPGQRVTEAKIREILEKAIEFAQKRNK